MKFAIYKNGQGECVATIEADNSRAALEKFRADIEAGGPTNLFQWGHPNQVFCELKQGGDSYQAIVSTETALGL